MGGALKQGYATAGTDTGHEGQAEDASWAYKHPEKIKDFGWRGLHLTAVAAKAVIAAYFGDGAKKSYFDSCSDGGREALMEAQRFPEDYDGILAGAPANNWTRMLSSGLDITKTVVDPEAYVNSMKLPAITKAVLEQCDAQDGVKDGVLNDPRTCRFNPAVLLCKDGDSRECLTEK
jgi:feruloyl esterase